MFMFTFYFFINWSTKIASERGLSDTAAIAMSSLVNLGGIAGGIVFGLVASRLSLPKLVATLTLLMSGGIVAFGSLPADVVVLNAACLVLGFCLWGASATIYSVIALSYPARVRASGIGTVVTVGRAGSALGPWVAGLLRGDGLDWAQVSLLLAVPGVLAALLVLTLRPDSYAASPAVETLREPRAA
jgi:cyanate permease